MYAFYTHTNRWIANIKFGGRHASKFGILVHSSTQNTLSIFGLASLFSYSIIIIICSSSHILQSFSQKLHIVVADMPELPYSVTLDPATLDENNKLDVKIGNKFTQHDIS